MKQYLEQEGELLRHAENNGYDHYLTIRTRFNSGEFSSFDFIFLSRAGFNDMMRFGSKGNWNIPLCKMPDRFAQAYIFYHNGGNIENRREVVEALVCNFETNGFTQHNHGLKEKQQIKQLEFNVE
jgi:site-specific DNA-adenine methylase